MDRAARFDEGIGEDVLDRVDRTDRDPGGLEPGDQAGAGLLPDQPAHDLLDRIAVDHPGRCGGKARVGAQFGHAQLGAEGAELAVVADRDDHRPVGHGEGRIGHHGRVAVAHPPRHDPADQIARGLVGHHRDLRIEQRNVDLLALAGAFGMAQRGKDRDGGVHARGEVGHRHPDLERRTIGLAGHAHQPAHPLGEEIVAAARCIGAVLPETGDRAIDDPRVDRPDRGIIQPVFGQPANLEILHQHIGPRGQPPDQFGPLRRCQIDRRAALVAVGAKIIGALARIVRSVGKLEERRTPAAGIVAAAGLLDLEHVGAEIGEDLGRPRTGQDPRKVQHLDPFEGTGFVAHRAPMPGRIGPV